MRHVGYLWKALTASAWLGSFAIQESLPRHSWMLHSCGMLSGSVKNMYTTPNNFEVCVAIKWDWKYKTPEVCIPLSLFYFRMSPQRTFPKPNVTFWKTFKKIFCVWLLLCPEIGCDCRNSTSNRKCRYVSLVVFLILNLQGRELPYCKCWFYF